MPSRSRPQAVERLTLMEELDTRAASDLTRHGYCCLEGALSSDSVDALGDEISALAARERRDGTAWFSHGNQRIFNLLRKSATARSLISHGPAMQLVTHLLGRDVLLSSITANIALPGNRPQHLHADQGYVPMPWPRVEAVNIIWVIDPFTGENGATRVIPGSHRRESPPTGEELPVPIEAPAGAIVCLDGRVWHGTGVNQTSATPRRALFAYYCRPYLRQQENFCRSLPRAFVRSLSPAERRLLGFDIWEGLGAVNGLPTSWMDGRARIGPTNEDHLFPDDGDEP